MSKNKFVFDTNIIQSKVFDPNQLPKTLYASSVVLFELMTASNDVKQLRGYQQAWRKAESDGLLIEPNDDDWLDASQVSFRLAQERKQQAGGKSPKRAPLAKQEIALDCLLAMSASRTGITIITNDTDFLAIKRYRKNLKLLPYPFDNI